MRSDPLQTRLSQAGRGQRGYVKSIERGKVGLVAPERPEIPALAVGAVDLAEYDDLLARSAEVGA
jgi:hypothetical protein